MVKDLCFKCDENFKWSTILVCRLVSFSDPLEKAEATSQSIARQSDWSSVVVFLLLLANLESPNFAIYDFPTILMHFRESVSFKLLIEMTWVIMSSNLLNYFLFSGTVYKGVHVTLYRQSFLSLYVKTPHFSGILMNQLCNIKRHLSFLWYSVQ